MRVGVDMGGTKIEIAALGRGGEILLRRRIPTPRGDYDASLRAVRALLEGAEGALGATIPRVGIGFPGSPSPLDGRVRNANSTWLNGRPLQADLEAALGRPVACANDADCFALSEARDGVGAGAGVVFGIIAGTGLGGGIVVRGRILTGAMGAGGEWGHAPLPAPRESERPGPACWCGRRGCLETWLSGPGLAADHARALGLAPADAPDAAQIAAAAEAGDGAAQAALDRHAERFARALGPVVNLIDPHVVALGGGLSNLPGFAAKLAAALTPHVFSDHVATRIARARHGDSSGVRGAAWLWDEREEEARR